MFSPKTKFSPKTMFSPKHMFSPKQTYFHKKNIISSKKMFFLQKTCFHKNTSFHQKNVIKWVKKINKAKKKVGHGFDLWPCFFFSFSVSSFFFQFFFPFFPFIILNIAINKHHAFVPSNCNIIIIGRQ